MRNDPKRATNKPLVPVCGINIGKYHFVRYMSGQIWVTVGGECRPISEDGMEMLLDKVLGDK